MISKEKLHWLIPESKNGEFGHDQTPKGIVIDSKVNVPVYIPCHGNVHLLFFKSFEGVDFHKDHKIESEDEQGCVDLAGRQDYHEPTNHQDGRFGSLEEVRVEFRFVSRCRWCLGGFLPGGILI